MPVNLVPVGRECSSQSQARQYQPNRRNPNYRIVWPSNHSAGLAGSWIELRTKHESLLKVLDENADFGGHPAACRAHPKNYAFSAEAGMSFGRWRQQARLFAALEMLAQGESVTEAAVAVGYDSVSAFIEMFRKMLGTMPQMYFRSKQETVPK